MSVLLLRLAGPLQSWGSAARFNRRSTENAPTKSGVLGLLASAQGRTRDADLSDLVALRFGVRIDQPGSRLRDFHTAHHADSGKAMPLSERFYLADAVFVAGLEGDTLLLQRLYEALLEPRFLPFLGRRSCPPSQPLDLGPPSESTLEEALRGAEWQASRWHRKLIGRETRRDGGESSHSLDLLIDCPPDQIPDFSLRDAPQSFDPRHRRYGLRGVRGTQAGVPPGSAKDAAAPPHDPTTLLTPALPGSDAAVPQAPPPAHPTTA
ncbi:type I-E CRISPR-associated protein Cas5/CasD [Streptomyces zagrosensis]|uniref:CRISPR system Cascade subunit CasD n=1 Tax=Streptomyces zagrosensis TaxID=1042984 RepID=A0A7W9Q5G6_9ACTN|nr:type I-E CRISPR-associated protein Cas5/CasD [Streptomyces zagrosensis]MBB5933941.1 CRISPR system Cascade subunit CasD [Streptomyces zagrosensis]